jgi:hypothetical protein
MHRVFLDKVKDSQPVKYFPSFTEQEGSLPVHSGMPPIRILSRMDLVHTIIPYLISILILSPHLRLGLKNGVFPSDFPKFCIHFSSLPYMLHALPISSIFMFHRPAMCLLNTDKFSVLTHRNTVSTSGCPSGAV